MEEAKLYGNFQRYMTLTEGNTGQGRGYQSARQRGQPREEVGSLLLHSLQCWRWVSRCLEGAKLPLGLALGVVSVIPSMRSVCFALPQRPRCEPAGN